MSHANKATKKEKEERIIEVQTLLLEGHNTAEVVRSLIKKYDITERMAYQYIKHAFTAFKEAIKGEMDERVAYHISARLNMYKKLDHSTADGARAALAILQDIAKLEGISIQKIDVTTKGQPVQSKIHVNVIIPGEGEENGIQD